MTAQARGKAFYGKQGGEKKGKKGAKKGKKHSKAPPPPKRKFKVIIIK